ncbi:MAG: ATP-binding protein [Halobacteriales archaeon]
MVDVADPDGDERTVEVDAPGDAVRARNAAETVAEVVGFGETERSELGQVAVELATNLLEHAGGGTIAVEPIASDAEAERGLRLISTDRGPGMPDADAAFAVGASSGDSLGHGLATVNRIMDTVEITPRDGAEGGTRVAVERWVKPFDRSREPCPYAIGAATRSMRPAEPNGDSFVVKRWDRRVLVGVIDGLGHGRAANEAAVRARDYVESHYDRPLSAVFRGTERALKGTRGVVMVLARFDWAEGEVAVANVGNVAVRVSGAARSGFPVRRGVVGANGPDPAVDTTDWGPEATMVIHTDGIAGRWSWDDIRALDDRSASAIASWMLREHGKETDDATAVAVTGSDDE